jgi:hypothetical protein
MIFLSIELSNSLSLAGATKPDVFRPVVSSWSWLLLHPEPAAALVWMVRDDCDEFVLAKDIVKAYFLIKNDHNKRERRYPILFQI